MAKKEFKLSKNLFGHSLDVRAVSVTSKNDIISASRDKTAKYWAYNDLQSNYQEVMTYRGQKNFVASVAYLEPSANYPDGLVLAGGNDHNILVYRPAEPFAIFTLKEHTNTVSCLSIGIGPNTFISGSWDMSAKFWKLGENNNKALVTYSGHTAAIWDVIQISDSRIITASADKTIVLWNSNGEKLQTLTGHNECVRGLTDFPELNVFISVANDASVKVWTYEGEIANTYYGHTNYIYSIARCKKNSDNAFVTCGEDNTVRFWENGDNIQTIVLPAQSVWCVACMENGDIVCGSSDGVVRVFTQDEDRVADEPTLTKFNEEVNAIQQQSKQEIGGVKISDLPGKEALFTPGNKPGQMKMVREPGGVVAYTWVVDGANSHWEKIGEVLGGADKDSEGKTLYEGKAYDFVFSVDVEDGKPPLKLPYNRGDDVYQAAHAFLTKHFLPAAYLEQVVDFILKNSKDKFVPPTNEFQDPLTGGNRYAPSYSANAAPSGVNLDPFTGGSSYNTTINQTNLGQQAPAGMNSDPFTGSSSYTSTTSLQSGNFFPVDTYKTFDMGDPNVILNKLKEFNQHFGDSNIGVDESDLEDVVKLCVGTPNNGGTYDLLFKLLEWPDDIIFPVLDIVRMAVKYEKNNETIVSTNNGAIIEKLKQYTTENCKIGNNMIVALRTLSNLLAHEAGENIIYSNRFEILENVTSLGVLTKNAQIGLATLLLNLTVLTVKRNDDLGFAVLAQVIPDLLTKFTDAESHFRGYVAIGTLVAMANNQKSEVVAKINENTNFLTTMQLHTFSGANVVENKRTNCVKLLKSII